MTCHRGGFPNWDRTFERPARLRLSYDAAGRLADLQSAISHLQYTYDDANQLLSETQATTGQTPQTLSYTYTDDGQRHTVTYPNGTVVTNDYTAQGLLKTLTLNGAINALATYDYDPLGRRVSRTYDNGTASHYAYTANSQVAQITHTNGAGVFASFEYGYNSLGHRMYEKRAHGLGDAYQYDLLGQVTNVQYEAWDVDTNPQFANRAVGYQYDPNGNRESVIDNGVTDTYVANVLNQYTNITMGGGWAGVPTYDGNGNLTTSLGTTNTYDAQNRLLSSENGTNRMVFEYDAKNRCVRRQIYTQTGATWSFSHAYLLYYDGWNLVEERATNNTAICHYVHGANTDEILVRVGAADPVYRYENALGSVTALASTTGDVVETYQYDIYGKASIADAFGVTLAATGFQNRFLFTGRECLKELGIYDYRNRMYSCSLGRFLQIDPVRFMAGDVNLYRYVGNGPSQFVDPDGLLAISTLVAASVAAVSAYVVYNALSWAHQSGQPRDVYTLIGVAIGALVSSELLSWIRMPAGGGSLAAFIIGAAFVGAVAGFAAFVAETGLRGLFEEVLVGFRERFFGCKGRDVGLDVEITAGLGGFLPDVEYLI